MGRQAGGGPRAKLTHFADSCVPPAPGEREAARLKQARCCCWAEHLLTVRYTTEGIMVEAYLLYMIWSSYCVLDRASGTALLATRQGRVACVAAHRHSPSPAGRSARACRLRYQPFPRSGRARPRPWAAARVTPRASSAQKVKFTGLTQTLGQL